MSSRSLSRQRSMSNHSPVPPQFSMPKGKETAIETPFEPCAATPSLFLYAEGPTVVCLHHDSLTVERRFQKHAEDIQFICVDNVSERGAGRLVVTYDVGKTAIVWDLFSGEQISRFASYEPLTVAAWMRNGNLAFGNEKGEVVLFEPATSEHVSARTIFDPITAIAPSSDCKTYAIGYRNGSILLAALQPAFTILHTLTTPRAPSPIATLLWHASSSKQKSDMLATHTIDGDLRVWSVAKPATTGAPRIIRALRRSESDISTRHWISWSRNGRILQFSNGETYAWDVRTKDVTYEPVPTIDLVRGIAAYGPTGTLFTMSANHTVQQYDIETAQLVANVQHIPQVVPQTPPQDFTHATPSSESEGELASPMGQNRLDAYAAEAARLERSRSSTSRSSHGRDELSGSPRKVEVTSPAAKTTRTTTTMSFATQSSALQDLYSPISSRSGRKGSRLRQEVIRSPEEKPAAELFPYIRARLSDVPYRQPRPIDESLMTPDALRQQMLSVVFGWDDDIHTMIIDELSHLSPENPHAVYLSRWLDYSPEGAAESISNSGPNASLDWIRLALSSIADSQQAKHVTQVFVEKLLTQGDVHAAVTILLASGDYDDAIEVYVSRKHHLEAVLLTCLLMPTDWQRQSFLVRKWGEHVVQSQQHLAVRCFSCTGVEPTEPWTSPRAQMATTTSSPAAPTLQPNIYHKMMERRGLQDSTSPIAMPAVSVPTSSVSGNDLNGPSSISGLKLVTSFAGKDHYKFPGLLSSDGTPINAALPTPIAESAAPRSALSPMGTGSQKSNNNNMRSLNTVLASRNGTPINLHRSRLPSIGETSVDVDSSDVPRALVPRGSSRNQKDQSKQMDNQKIREELPLLLTPAVYEPPELTVEQTPQTAISSKVHDHFVTSSSIEEQNGRRQEKRAGSRSRKPDGLSIRMFPVNEDSPRRENSSANPYAEPIERPTTTESTDSIMSDSADFINPPHTGHSYGSFYPPLSGNSLSSYNPPLSGTSYGSFIPPLTGDSINNPPLTGNSYSSYYPPLTGDSINNPPLTGNSYTSYKSMQSPSVTGKSLDQYISSLEQAQYYKVRPRGNSAASKQSRDDQGRRKQRQDQMNEDAPNIDDARMIPPPKRSPSSPVPMNTEDLRYFTQSSESLDSAYLSTMSANHSSRSQTTAYSVEKDQAPLSAAPSERHKNRSRSRQPEGKSRNSSRTRSRRPSPDRTNSYRGRSKSRRDDSATRSPSSPEPMPAMEEGPQSPPNADPALRFVAQNRSRLNSDTSRRRDRSVSKPRQASPDRRAQRMRSRSRQPEPLDTSITNKHGASSRGDLSRRRAESSVDLRRGVRDQEQPLIPDQNRPQSSRPDFERPKTSNSQHIASSRRTKELAQAELEARRLSLARRPSAPAVPFPGQLGSHNKSASVDYPPPLPRAQTDINATYRTAQSPQSAGPGLDYFSRTRSVTPGAMKSSHLPKQSTSTMPNSGELLGSNVYQPPRFMDKIMTSPGGHTADQSANPEPPSDMPKHKYYDANIGTSRQSIAASSSHRNTSRERTMSRERTRTSNRDVAVVTIGEECGDDDAFIPMNYGPPMVPELQHLAIPPPPPPPPAPPKDASHLGGLRIQTSENGLLPSSTYSGEPTSAFSTSEPNNSRHRRAGSNNDNQLVGKIRGFAGRIRSDSRGRSASRQRENSARSPANGPDEANLPYETMIQPTQQAHQQLSTVLEGR